MQLTAAQLQQATSTTPALAQRYLQGINAALTRYNITTPLRVAHFLAQLGHESISLTATVESLNYTVEKLLETFSRRRLSVVQAQALGRTTKQPARQQDIANTVYGGEWGRVNLGNTQPNDGWHFRGRGLMQTTGRTNYRALSDALEIDFMTQPERLNEPELAALAAGYYWFSRGVNKHADADNVEAVSRAVNGGTNGLEDRKRRLLLAKKALGLPLMPRVTPG